MAYTYAYHGSGAAPSKGDLVKYSFRGLVACGYLTTSGWGTKLGNNYSPKDGEDAEILAVHVNGNGTYVDVYFVGMAPNVQDCVQGLVADMFELVMANVPGPLAKTKAAPTFSFAPSGTLAATPPIPRTMYVGTALSLRIGDRVTYVGQPQRGYPCANAYQPKFCGGPVNRISYYQHTHVVDLDKGATGEVYDLLDGDSYVSVLLDSCPGHVVPGMFTTGWARNAARPGTARATAKPPDAHPCTCDMWQLMRAGCSCGATTKYQPPRMFS